MMVTAVRLTPQATPSAIHLAMVVIGAGLLVTTSITPVWIIIAAALVGSVVR